MVVCIVYMHLDGVVVLFSCMKMVLLCCLFVYYMVLLYVLNVV